MTKNSKSNAIRGKDCPNFGPSQDFMHMPSSIIISFDDFLGHLREPPVFLFCQINQSLRKVHYFSIQNDMASSNDDVIIVIKSIDSKADKAVSRRMSKWFKGLMRSLKIRGVQIYHRLKSRFIFTGHVTLKKSYMIKVISRMFSIKVISLNVFPFQTRQTLT